MQYTLSAALQDTYYFFSSLCLLKSPESLLGVSCLGSLGVGCFCVHFSSSELDFLGFWTSDIWDLAILCRKFLHFIFFLCVCSVLYTKNALKSAQFGRHIWLFNGFPQNWIITAVLVCPVYALREFIVLENSIKFFISRSVLLSFLSVFTVVVSWIMHIIHTSLLSIHTWTVMSLFLWNAHCPVFKWLVSCSSPQSTTNSHVSV